MLEGKPLPLDFINEENLKTFELAPMGEPHIAPAIALLVITAPPAAISALSKATVASIGGFGAYLVCCFDHCLSFLFTCVLLFFCVGANHLLSHCNGF